MDNFMKAAVLYAPGDLRVVEVPIPDKIGSDEVLIKVRAAGICGSDLDRVMKAGTYSFPTIPGHEFCGEVEETGCNVSSFKKGDRVVVVPILPCFLCEFCQQGNYGLCSDYNYLGSRTDGGFAQYVKVPSKNIIEMPETISFVEGAVVEPASVALHGVNKADIKAGDTVAVLGCGTIGLFAIQFVKLLGAGKVIATDISHEKLEIAKILGADLCIDVAENDVVQSIMDITGNKGVNVAIETAGINQTQEQCLCIAKKQGRIVYFGTAHRDVVIRADIFESIVRNELKITGSWNSYSAPFPGMEWKVTLDFIAAGKLKLLPLISHTFDLYDAPKVFKDMTERKYIFNKVIFTIN